MSLKLLLELVFALCAGGAATALFFDDRRILPLLGWLGSMASLTMFALGVLGIA